MKRMIFAAVAAGFVQAAWAGVTHERLDAVAASAQRAARADAPETAKEGAAKGFDWSSMGAEAIPTSAQTVATAEPGDGVSLTPSGERPDLFVGSPQRLSEPSNPLTPEGKAKPQGTGTKVWWALGGAALGALIGFLIGGPMGALIGAAAGAAAGWFLGP